MDGYLVRAIIETKKDREGIIIDKARCYENGASSTVYICVDKEAEVFEVKYNEIKKVKSFQENPMFYIKKPEK